MKNFFEYIRYKYNTKIADNLKKYSKAVEKKANLKERSKFLQHCRELGMIPKYIQYATRQIKNLFELPQMKKEAEKIEYRLHTKLLNTEIAETHTPMNAIGERIQQIDNDLVSTLEETELTKFKDDQWRKYKNIRIKTKKTHLSKITDLKKE